MLNLKKNFPSGLGPDIRPRTDGETEGQTDGQACRHDHCRKRFYFVKAHNILFSVLRAVSNIFGEILYTKPENNMKQAARMVLRTVG
jgi:hypothetical protein